MTADKDDPRFDEFYQYGSIVRYFIALFMTDLPSYTGAGFEVRNQHLVRGKNEEYSKLYVFQIFDEEEPDKYTTGPYLWGQNSEQFDQISELRRLGESLLPDFAGQPLRWHIHPDPTLSQYYVAWQIQQYVFVCNLNTTDACKHVSIPQKTEDQAISLVYSSRGTEERARNGNGLFYTLNPLAPNECRIYLAETPTHLIGRSSWILLLYIQLRGSFAKLMEKMFHYLE